MAIPQAQNPQQSAPPVDLSDSLVPKSPVAASQNVDLSDSLVPKNTSQSQGDLHLNDLITGRKPQAASSSEVGPGGAYAALGTGFVKGAKETVRTLGNAADWISKQLGGQQEQQNQEVPFKNEDLESKNPTESGGKAGEGIAEFLLGDEAIKGLGVLEKGKHLVDVGKMFEKSPKIAKAVEIAANSLRQGTVSGAQTLAHGGSAEDAAQSALVVGGSGAILEGAGQGVKAVKNFISRGAQTEELGQSLVKGLTGGATPEQVARTVGQNLDTAEQTMHDSYNKGMQSISSQGARVPVPIPGSPLQKVATDLLSDSQVPESMATALKGVVPDADKIEPFLKQLSESKEILTWDQMEATRQKIGQTIRKLPWDSPIRPDLIKLRYAIDDTLEQAADKAGNSDLSDQIKSLRGDYAQSKSALEERAIVALRDKSPDTVASILLNKESVHNVNTLRRLIGPKNMQAVEGSIIDKMIQDASKNGELQGRQLFRKFNSLGPDAKQAIWGDRLPQVQQFMQQAGSLSNVVLDRIVSHYAPLAIGGTALIQAEKGDFKSAGTTAATGIALAAILKNPAVLEYALKGISGLQKTVPPAASAIMQPEKPASPTPAKQEDESTPPKPQATATPDKTWLKFKGSDGTTYSVHPEDWAEVQKRDPKAEAV